MSFATRVCFDCTYQEVLLTSPMLLHTKLMSKMAVGINDIHCNFNIILKFHLDKFMGR